MGGLARLGQDLLRQPNSSDVQHVTRLDALPDLPTDKAAPHTVACENCNRGHNSDAGESVATLAVTSAPRGSNGQATNAFAAPILTLLWVGSWGEGLESSDKARSFNHSYA